MAIAYAAAVGNGFVWDDDDYVTANETLRSWDGLRRLWAEPGVVPQYYPVTFTSFWLEYRLWGLWAPGFHATNVLLHAANAVLAHRLLAALAVPGAWVAAALFAVHPVHVESVAWITERKNVLSGLFYLAAALVFVTRVADGAARRRPGPYAAAVGLFVLALLSKSVTATLPVALAIALWWRDGRVRWRDARLLLPLLALGAGAGALTAWMERTRVGAEGPYWDHTFPERVLIAGRALWFYAASLAWPHPLAFSYGRWTVDARDALQWAWPLAAVTAGAAAWAARARAGRGPAAAMAFFVVTLGPALGFVNVYPMRYAFVADHFQYLASLGLLAAAGAAVARLAGARAPAVAAPALAVLAVLAWRQSHAYRDPATLWADTLAKRPRAILALQNLGTIEYARGNVPAALALWERARDIEPAQPDVWNSIGLAQARLGRRHEAVATFEHALRLDARHAEAARNLGSVLAAAGRRDEAIASYERAIAIAPEMLEAHEDLAVVLGDAGRHEEAARRLFEVVRLAPAAPGPRVRLARALGAQGRWREAIAAYEAAIRLVPQAADLHAELAGARAAAASARDGVTPGDRGTAAPRGSTPR